MLMTLSGIVILDIAEPHPENIKSGMLIVPSSSITLKSSQP